ncbi:unnamed protein product [Somion occarium]|uniref:Ribonuclease H1 N-terminal domain-containing protein n=1 Tax=Somion occarium TaxID=3059160 RepID=A0ABP1DJI3_9APHY
MGGRKAAYVVTVGTVPGVYDNWEETAEKVVGVPRSVFKGYSTMLEARKAYRDALIAQRVKVVTVEDPGPNGDLNNPRYTVPPPLAPSPSSSSTSSSSSQHSSHTVIPASHSTLVTIYPDRSQAKQLQSIAQSSTSDGAGSPPTVGTVQTAMDNLSVSSERRRHGGEGTVSGPLTTTRSRESNEGSSSMSRSRSIRSSPPTAVTQIEPSLSSRHISSSGSPSVTWGSLPIRYNLHVKSSSSANSGSGSSPESAARSSTKSRRSKHRRKKSPQSSPEAGIPHIGSSPMTEVTYKHFSSSSQPSLGASSSRPNTVRRADASKSPITRPLRTQDVGSTGLSIASYSAYTHSPDNASGTRVDNPSWSPQTNVTYMNSGSYSPLPSDRSSVVDEGFATAPSSPDSIPSYPNDNRDEIQAIASSSPPASVSARIPTPDRSSDRIRLIASPGSSNGRSSVHSKSCHSERTTVYSEAAIQTDPTPTAQPQAPSAPAPAARICHRCQQSLPSSPAFGGDTVPATPNAQLTGLPSTSYEAYEGLNALGLTQSMFVPNMSHEPGLDPRSPIARSTSLPANAPAFGRPSPRLYDGQDVRPFIHQGR